MTDLNELILIGRLTQDCGAEEKSFQYVGNGIAKAVVSLAVNRSIKKNGNWVDDVSYFNVTIWGKTAENLRPYLTKGKQICVCGYIQQDRWTDDNGNKKSRVSLVADTVQLLGNNNQQNNNNQNNNGGNFQQNNGGYNQNENYDYNNNNNGFPEDIPFGN